MMEYEVLELDEQPSQQPYEAQYEGVPEWIGRQISRTGSRAAETAIGTPRAGYDLIQGVSNLMPESVRNAVSTGLKGIDPTGGMVGSLMGALGPNLPSSENIQSTIAQTAQPGYLEPQSPGEEVADAITKTTTNLLLGKIGMPIKPGSIKEGFNLIGRMLSAGGKATASASAGQASKFLAKSLGAGEFGQEATNFAVTLLTSAGLDTNIKQAANEVYAVRDKAVRQGDLMHDKSLAEKIEDTIRKYLNVGPENLEGKAEIRDAINSINKEAFGMSHYRLENLPTIKSQIGESAYKVTTPSAQRILKDLYKQLTNALKDPAKTGNKVFSEAQAAGDELWTHVKTSESINDWAKSVVQSKPLLGAGAVGTLYAAAKNPQGTALAAGLVGGGLSGAYGAAKAGNFIWSVMANPSVRKEYMRMMQAASKQNVPLFVRSAEKFNKSMEPEYEVLELD